MPKRGFDKWKIGEIAEIEIVTGETALSSDCRIFLNGYEVTEWVAELEYKISGEDGGGVPQVWLMFPASVTILSEQQKEALKE